MATFKWITFVILMMLMGCTNTVSPGIQPCGENLDNYAETELLLSEEGEFISFGDNFKYMAGEGRWVLVTAGSIENLTADTLMISGIFDISGQTATTDIFCKEDKDRGESIGYLYAYHLQPSEKCTLYFSTDIERSKKDNPHLFYLGVNGKFYTISQ